MDNDFRRAATGLLATITAAAMLLGGMGAAAQQQSVSPTVTGSSGCGKPASRAESPATAMPKGDGSDQGDRKRDEKGNPTTEEQRLAIDASMLPPDMVREIVRRSEQWQFEAGRRWEIDRTRRADEVPHRVEEIVVKQTVTLEGRAAPYRIYGEVGYLSTVAVIDVTGQPWPIVDYHASDRWEVRKPGAGTTAEVTGAKEVPDAEANVLWLQPKTLYVGGSLSLRLKGLATPVVFSLKAGEGRVHARYDAVIQRTGPLADIPVIAGSVRGGSMVAGDRVMLDLAGGVVPAGWKAMTVEGGDGQTRAWDAGDSLVLKTPHTLVSPAWTDHQRFETVQVFRVRKVAAVVMAPMNGVPVTLRLRGRPATDTVAGGGRAAGKGGEP